MAKRLYEGQDARPPGNYTEVVLGMMLLKHIRNWSFEALIREVRANLVYWEFYAHR
jgi:transposase, IS5 family